MAGTVGVCAPISPESSWRLSLPEWERRPGNEPLVPDWPAHMGLLSLRLWGCLFQPRGQGHNVNFVFQVGLLLRSLASSRKLGDGDGGSLVVPLRGGAAAFVTRSASRRLITTLTAADAETPSSGVAGWLERRQAHRSAVLIAPDRASGVAVALRWGLSPERFRLAEDFSSEEGAKLAAGRERPWHSRR